MAAYTTITIPLLTAMNIIEHGAGYTSTNESSTYKVKAQIYVDDNTNYYNEFKRSLEHALQTKPYQMTYQKTSIWQLIWLFST